MFFFCFSFIFFFFHCNVFFLHIDVDTYQHLSLCFENLSSLNCSAFLFFLAKKPQWCIETKVLKGLTSLKSSALSLSY